MTNSNTTIVAFYKFIALSDLSSLQTELKQFCNAHQIFGTLLLAKEGVNATLAGSKDKIEGLLNFISEKLNLNQQHLECKFSDCDFIPFRKLKVLIKKEIITMNTSGLDPEHKTGIRLNPEDWNKTISNNDVLVIDTRNQYEIEHGTFKNAINPNTEQFGEFPDYVKKNLDPKKHKKIAMFCTGGIRCEKASAYLIEQGFEEVYQLHGGILKYLTTVNPSESLWEGKCFVFDERIIV